MTELVRRPPGAMLDATPGDVVPNWGVFDLTGSPGLKRNSGYVNEEFMPRLAGRKAVRVYREMSDNSSVLGGWYAAVSELLRQIEWRVEPGGKGRESNNGAKFLEQNMEDMEHSWGDMITEICSFTVYGWELSEMLFKRRRGLWETDPLKQSKYSDGLIGFRAIEGRAQDTMQRWVFGPNGEILGMVQMAAPRYQERVIPLGKCLHFRTTKEKNNPEGRSLLRNAVEAYYYVKRHQEIEAVGVARDLAGMPMAKVPPKLMQANATLQDKAMFDAIKRLVTSVSRNENEGIVWPWEPDEHGNSEYDFELVTSGGSRQFNTDGIITRYKTEMLQSVLADFLQVGHENTGSYNMHTDKTGLFRTSINALAQMIADQFNRKAIPLLFKLNNWKPSELPTIVPNNVDPPDLTVLGGFLQQTAALGIQWFPDPVAEKFVRDAAGMPQLSDRDEKILQVEQQQARVLTAVQQRLSLMQADQQAVAGQQQMMQGQLSMDQSQQGDPAADQAAGQQAAAAQQDQDQKAVAGANDAARGKVALDTDKVKLKQEKQKLVNLRQQRPASQRSANSGRQPVKKAYRYVPGKLPLYDGHPDGYTVEER